MFSQPLARMREQCVLLLITGSNTRVKLIRADTGTIWFCTFATPRRTFSRLDDITGSGEAKCETSYRVGAKHNPAFVFGFAVGHPRKSGKNLLKLASRLG